MSLVIDITDMQTAINGAAEYLISSGDKILVKAVRKSMTRTLTGLRKEASTSIRTMVRIKAREAKGRMKAVKPRGSDLRRLEATLFFSSRALPLLMFITGKKNPRSQKGVKVRRRRPIKAHITPGKKFTLKKAFIADVNSLQVFKRSKPGKSGLKKQGTKSLAQFLKKDNFRRPLEDFIQARMAREFNQHYKFFLGRI